MTEEELIVKYEPLVFKVAKKFYNVEINDLYQAGCIGLIKASRRYDKNMQTSFIDFAYKYIFREMYELANKSRNIKLNKAYLSLYKKIEEAKKSLTLLNNKEPSFNELCAYLEIDESLASEVVTLTKEMLSLDDEYQTINGSTLPIKECIGKEEDIDSHLLIEDSLDNLEPLEQQVIKIRYFSDFTQSETANYLGISQVKVSRIEQKGKEKIKKYIAS
jgi:RNA polymerase sporulation-specific sigma factor